jgi:hypothetical protein
MSSRKTSRLFRRKRLKYLKMLQKKYLQAKERRIFRRQLKV